MNIQSMTAIAAGAALCAAGAFADGLPGRIEYAVNLGKATQTVGRFLPVGSTYWQEGKSWNQIKNETFTAPSGYEECADIYKTYVYPNDTTADLSAVYRFPNLTPGGTYTLRIHVAEVYFQWADCRKFNIIVNGETKIAALDPFVLAENNRYKGAYADIAATADETGALTVTFANIKDQFNVAAIEIFDSDGSLPVPSPRVRRETRGVNAIIAEPRNAAYLYDVQKREGNAGTVRDFASGVSGLRLIDIRGKDTTQYRARAVLGENRGEWSAWTPVDSSACASDAAIKIACADPGQTPPSEWLKDEPYRVFPDGATVSYWQKWENFDLSLYGESDRPPLAVFNLAVQSGTSLAYRITGLDSARAYRVRIHQMEPWTAVNSGGWRYFAYHFNNSLDKAKATTGETQIDPYVLAGNATWKANAVDYEVTPDCAGTILIAGENLKDAAYWFGFEIHPLGEVVDPAPPGLCIFVR